MDTLHVTASATGNPRNKTALKPGRSLMDWIRLTNTNKDLSGCGGRLRDVTPDELARHNKKDDAWMAIRGKVYNVTPYFEFHPGGEDELNRGIGSDATDLFDQVHRWVNLESMLSKCLVGRLKSSNLPAKRQTYMPSVPIIPLSKEASSVTSDWIQTLSSITIIFYTRQKNLSPHSVSASCDGFRLKVRISQNGIDFNYSAHLEKEVERKPAVKVSSLTGKVELVFNKISKLQWQSLGTIRPVENTSPWFRKAVLSRKQEVTHNVHLFSFTFDEGDVFSVPLGWHVQVKITNQDGASFIRSYTPVPSSLLTSDTEPCPDSDPDSQRPVLHFLIKMYAEGPFTSALDKLPEGSCVEISDPTGSFSFNPQYKNLIAIAAGTGITPMTRLIQQSLNSSPDQRVWLLFFNRKSDDIIWCSQWNQLAQKHSDRLKIWHILSEPDSDWNGLMGRISETILDQTVKSIIGPESASLTCVCGPTDFTTETVRLLEKSGSTNNAIHAFLG